MIQFKYLNFGAALAALMFISQTSYAKNPGVVSAERPEPAIAAQPEGDLSEQEKQMLALTRDFAQQIDAVIAKWLSQGEITEDKLFNFLYYPIADTDPPKFHTDYDRLADRDFQAIEDAFMAKSEMISYAIFSDIHAYIPTHNQKYSAPLTGNRATDLINNRTKRIFSEIVPVKASRNQAPFLIQVYQRDTGEKLGVVSVPIWVHGKHFGCVRIGYRVISG